MLPREPTPNESQTLGTTVSSPYIAYLTLSFDESKQTLKLTLPTPNPQPTPASRLYEAAAAKAAPAIAPAACKETSSFKR